jgi:CheY-like chemotaxis protein
MESSVVMLVAPLVPPSLPTEVRHVVELNGGQLYVVTADTGLGTGYFVEFPVESQQMSLPDILVSTVVAVSLSAKSDSVIVPLSDDNMLCTQIDSTTPIPAPPGKLTAPLLKISSSSARVACAAREESMSSISENTLMDLTEEADPTHGSRRTSSQCLTHRNSNCSCDEKTNELLEENYLRVLTTNKWNIPVVSDLPVTRMTSDRTYRKVLVVEDSPMARMMMCKILSEHFHFIDMAVDGVEGLRKFKECLYSGGAMYDVILMDYEMPNMDGPTAATAIRACGFQGLIIGVTGNTLPHQIDAFVARGVNRVLPKPFKVQDLLPILANFKLEYKPSKQSLSKLNLI